MATTGAGMVAPVSVKTSMSYDDSKADDFERKSMGSDDGSEDYKVRCRCMQWVHCGSLSLSDLELCLFVRSISMSNSTC